MNIQPSAVANSDSEDSLATLLACWLEKAFDLQEACALAGYDEVEFENFANDSAIRTRVARARALPNFGPFLARLKAKRHIASAVDRLQEIIVDPDSTAGSITKAAELLYVISQMRAEDGARGNIEQKEPFCLRIHIGERVLELRNS